MQELTTAIQLEDKIFICPKPVLTRRFLLENGISVVINMTGFDLDPIPDVKIENLSLSADELLEEEIPRAKEKISNIAAKLAYYVNIGVKCALVCNTGINKSGVVFGCYLRSRLQPCETLAYIHDASVRAGMNLLTNQSFKKILHERKKLTPVCTCWTQSVYDYRSQTGIDY